MQKKSGKNHHGKYNDKIAYFCVPADFKNESLMKLVNLNDKYKDAKIDEVYGSLPQTEYGSGRSSTYIPNVKFSQLKNYIKECNKYGIIFNYVLNASTLKNREFNNIEKKKIVLFIKKLSDAGVKRFTVTLPSLISLISNNLKDVEIVLSAVNNITSEYQLNEFLESGKIIRAYVAEEMNRQPHKLKSIVLKSKIPIATIVNPFCLFQCAYRYHHYNVAAFRDKNDKCDVDEYYQFRCEQIKANNPEEIIKIPWIRPSDINRYMDIGINYFKVAGREMIKVGADIPATVEAYMSKYYDGDLINLFNDFSNIRGNIYLPLKSKPLNAFFDYIFNKSTDCSRDLCDKCVMCKKYSKYVKTNKKEVSKLPKFKLLK